MKRAAIALITISLFPSGPLAQGPPAEHDFLGRIRRLTVEGRRAGEGYWSPDGRRLAVSRGTFSSDIILFRGLKGRR